MVLMPRHIFHQITVTAFAGFLVVTTLGMVLTVSADRSELTNETVDIPPIVTLVEETTQPYTFPTTPPTVTDFDSVTTTILTNQNRQTVPIVIKNENTTNRNVVSPVIIPVPREPVHLKPASTDVHQTAPAVSFAEAFTKRVFELTNEFRSNENLPPLIISTDLTKNATRYSQYMLQNKRLAHTDLLGCDLKCRFMNDGYKAQTWGENLAHYSFSDEPNVEDVAEFFMREWIKSAGHRANLVSPLFTKTGIGIAKDNHSIYVAVHFALP